MTGCRVGVEFSDSTVAPDSDAGNFWREAALSFQRRTEKAHGKSVHHMTTKPPAPSIWLRIVTFYFKAGGVLFLIIAALGFFSGLALDWAPGTTQGMSFPLLMGIVFAMAVSLLLTGILLGRRLRAGAVLGLVLTLYPLAFALIQRRTMGWLELGLTAVTAIVLLRVWRELEWRHTVAMILVVLFGVSCSPGSRETRQHPDSSAPTEQSAAVKAVAGRYSLPDFARLRWLEGSWRGRLPDGGHFYERYQFLDGSTIVMHSFADSTFARATDSARITLRGGTVADEGGTSRWVATRLDSNVAAFAAERDASDGFEWLRESPDRWKATLRSTDRQRRPVITVYPMERIRR